MMAEASGRTFAEMKSQPKRAGEGRHVLENNVFFDGEPPSSAGALVTGGDAGGPTLRVIPSI